MKTIIKWAALFALPSILLYAWVFNDLLNPNAQRYALFFTLHSLFAGAAIYFTLSELKKLSTEKPSVLRYVITGIVTAVSHAILLGLFTAFHINVIKPEMKEAYMEELVLPMAIAQHDSTVKDLDAYYDKLMLGKDTGFMPKDMYLKYDSMARDSINLVLDEVAFAKKELFGYWGVMKRWIAFAPIIGILFSVIVAVFINRR